MKHLLLILPLLLLLSVFGCEPKDEVVTTDPNAVLEFSADTVLFDTVFVTRGSVTKRLKVYNRNSKAVRISEITLAGSTSSPYQLTINGLQSPLANNVELRGGDSLYVLVKANINPTQQNQPFLVADSVLFRTNGQEQNVKLIAYGQNAYFHRKGSIGTSIWASDKPHVLLDTVLVQEDAVLTIEKGAQIFGYNKSALLVAGQLLVQGTPQERVVFRGYRREEDYLTAPGQWEGISILATSGGNRIRYADIKNTRSGLFIENPGMAATVVEGSVVAHAFANGILAYNSEVRLENSLIYNCGQYGFGGLGGGRYELLYATIVSYQNELLRSSPLLVIRAANQDSESRPLSLRLVNTIVYSDGFSFKDEVLIEPLSAATEVSNNVLRTEQYLTQFGNSGNILNKDPEFEAPAKYDFSLDTLSPASGAAKLLPSILQDIKGAARSSTKPDIGAYERTID